MKVIEEKHIACPSCKNKRLFDLSPGAGATGIVKIKCPICKNIIVVSLSDGHTSKE